MRVRMLISISGLRPPGVAWPSAGEEIDVSADEGAELCANGYAQPVKPAPETATLTTAESTTLPKPRSRTKRA